MASVTTANLGAWLLRCNPDVWDLPVWMEAGGDRIDNWRVVVNYRSRIMAPGQRVALWVSGNSRRIQRGIWGIGYVTSDVHPNAPGDDDEPHYWLDETSHSAATMSVSVDIPLWAEPITDTELKAAGIDDLEVQRQPQMSNPSWISVEQLIRLEPLLGDAGWPELPHHELVTVANNGAAFGAPAMNKIVEDAATAAVIKFYGEDWDVADVSDDNLGWDLTFTHRSGETALVEVKGVQGEEPTVLLTANELRAARSQDGWVLAVVTRALSDPQVSEFAADRVLAAAKPYVYRAAFPPK